MAVDVITGQEIPDVAVDVLSGEQIPAAPQGARSDLSTVEPNEQSLGLLRAFRQGAWLGWGDEVTAAMVAGLSAMTGEDFGDVYSSVLMAERRAVEQFAEQNPVQANVAEIAGGITSGAFLPGAAVGGGALRALLTGAGVGAVQGAGVAENVAEIPEQAATGAIVGGAIAPVLKGGQLGLAALKRTKAGNIVEGWILRHGETAEDIAKKVTDLGPNARIVDAMPDLAEDVALIPGGRKILEDFMKTRAGGHRARIMGSLSSLTRNTKNYWDNFEALDSARKNAAQPLYQDAYEQGLKWTNSMTDKAAKLAKAVPGAWRAAKNLAAMEDVFLPDKMPAQMHVEQLDWFKRGVDEIIPSLGKRKQLQRAVIKVKNELLEEVDKQVPAYKAARNAWAGPSEMLKAQHQGRQIFGEDFELTEKLVGKLTPGEKEAFVVGAVRAARDKILKPPENRKNVTSIFTPLAKERLKPAFPDEDAFNQFVKSIESENTFALVSNQVLAGSPTAKRQSFQEIGAAGATLASLLATGQGGWATLAFARMLSGRVVSRLLNKRMTEETATDIADLLTQGGTQDDIVRMIRSKGVDIDQAIKAGDRVVQSLTTGLTAGTIQ